MARSPAVTGRRRSAGYVAFHHRRTADVGRGEPPGSRVVAYTRQPSSRNAAALARPIPFGRSVTRAVRTTVAARRLGTDDVSPAGTAGGLTPPSEPAAPRPGHRRAGRGDRSAPGSSRRTGPPPSWSEPDPGRAAAARRRRHRVRSSRRRFALPTSPGAAAVRQTPLTRSRHGRVDGITTARRVGPVWPGGCRTTPEPTPATRSGSSSSTTGRRSAGPSTWRCSSSTSCSSPCSSPRPPGHRPVRGRTLDAGGGHLARLPRRVPAAALRCA